jgi:hypothetical protein
MTLPLGSLREKHLTQHDPLIQGESVEYYEGNLVDFGRLEQTGKIAGDVMQHHWWGCREIVQPSVTLVNPGQESRVHLGLGMVELLKDCWLRRCRCLIPESQQFGPALRKHTPLVMPGLPGRY